MKNMSSDFGKCVGEACPNFETLGEACGGSLRADSEVGYLPNFDGTYLSVDQVEIRCNTTPVDIQNGFAGDIINDPIPIRSIRSYYEDAH